MAFFKAMIDLASQNTPEWPAKGLRIYKSEENSGYPEDFLYCAGVTPLNFLKAA